LLPVARRDVGQRSWALQKMSPCRKTAGGNVGESDMDAGGLKKLFLVFDRLSMKVKTLGTEGHTSSLSVGVFAFSTRIL
jgi:hypothetical protein